MRPLASGLLLQAGHNEIRAHAFPMKVWGTKPAFLHRAYGMLIHCFVITIANLAIEPEASGKRGISAFVATHLLEALTKTVLQIDFTSVAMSGTVSIVALWGSAPRRSRNVGKPRRTPNRACHLRHDHVDVYPWLSILAARWSPWLVAAAVFGARVWRPHQPDRSGSGHGYAQNVKAPESLEVEMQGESLFNEVSALSFSRSCWPSPPAVHARSRPDSATAGFTPEQVGSGSSLPACI